MATIEKKQHLKAVLLIGGPSKGTRFRPLSLELPKPLFPIAGHPILYHHIKACISKLSPFIKEIILLGFYDPKLFTEFINQTSQELNIPILYFQEQAGLGTGGGLYKYRKYILEDLDTDSNLFVIHADILCSFPLKQILEFHLNHNKTCTLLSKKIGDNETRNFGCIVQDTSTLEVLHYAEKPETFVSNLVSCGVYLFKQKSLFNSLKRAAEAVLEQGSDDDTDGIFDSQPAALLATGDIRIQLEQQVLSPMAGKQEMYAFETKDWWIPLKTAGISLKCSQLLLNEYKRLNPEILAKTNPTQRGPTIIGSVIIHPTASVHTSAKIGPNVTLGANVKIGAGVRIKESIILDGVDIKDRVCLIYSIIGFDSVIGRWSRIEGVPDFEAKEESKNHGITIFGNNVITGPETFIRKCIVLPHKQLNENHFDEILL
eukprot:TRINITY_DN2289_c0_g1_i1.p1 TRINITY_DN2289_c0_g1~~TRINITY_DN2289_c0_g1_i1.p1  ORF type:complete len:445 (-),score=194.49 TRINITY_DN2289_c0_g1_i1:83-1372(-)